jgi:hypothetical protein
LVDSDDAFFSILTGGGIRKLHTILKSYASLAYCGGGCFVWSFGSALVGKGQLEQKSSIAIWPP